MKSTNGAIAPYSPGPAPSDLPDSAKRYLDDELHKIANLFQLLVGGLQLDVSYTVPPKARAGKVAYADGVKWNPGSGEGVYYLNGSGVWKLLG